MGSFNTFTTMTRHRHTNDPGDGGPLTPETAGTIYVTSPPIRSANFVYASSSYARPLLLRVVGIISSGMHIQFADSSLMRVVPSAIHVLDGPLIITSGSRFNQVLDDEDTTQFSTSSTTESVILTTDFVKTVRWYSHVVGVWSAGGGVSATLRIYKSNDTVNWLLLNSYSVSSSSEQIFADHFPDFNARYVRYTLVCGTSGNVVYARIRKVVAVE